MSGSFCVIQWLGQCTLHTPHQLSYWVRDFPILFRRESPNLCISSVIYRLYVGFIPSKIVTVLYRFVFLEHKIQGLDVRHLNANEGRIALFTWWKHGLHNINNCIPKMRNLITWTLKCVLRAVHCLFMGKLWSQSQHLSAMSETRGNS